MKPPESPELWHERLGHVGYGEKLARMVSDKLVSGVNVKPEEFRAKKSEVCEPCIRGKQTKQSFSESESEGSKEVLELLPYGRVRADARDLKGGEQILCHGA